MTIDISGKVIQGDHYGRKIGYPTANIDRRDFIRRKIKVRLGVWAGTAKTAGSSKQKAVSYRAAIVIGPIDKYRMPKIEAHLLNFKGNLYGKKITLTLIQYLRPFKKFTNEQSLKSQIKSDIEKIKSLNLNK